MKLTHYSINIIKLVFINESYSRNIRQRSAIKLFLTSYLAGTKELVQNFLTQNNVQKILFIPTAANVEEYRGYVDEGIAVLKETGYSVNILDIATTPHSKSVQAIKNSACLCISGGNTFYLLQELKRNGLLDLIKQKVQDSML